MCYDLEMKKLKLDQLIDESSDICFLTGAGVSTLSGIPDFQDTDKVWNHELPREIVISLTFFRIHPAEFWRVYRESFKTKVKARPNIVHEWISSLQEDKNISVITQNVDGLHQKAGSRQVLNVHGNIQENVCVKCRFITPDDGHTALPMCEKCEIPLKPNVVLFGERPVFGYESEQALLSCNLFIVMGTSLKVYPVASLPTVLRTNRPHIPQVWVNKDNHPEGFSFDLSIVDQYANLLNDFSK